MKVLLIYAHPEPRSLNGALKNFAIRHLQQAGHEVQVSDLYAMRWKAGYDADADGGRLVTVADLAASPLFEVVQIRGIDPESFPSGPF